LKIPNEKGALGGQEKREKLGENMRGKTYLKVSKALYVQAKRVKKVTDGVKGVRELIQESAQGG